MAVVSIPDEQRELTDVREIRDFLEQFGIWYENWEVEGRVDGDSDADTILAAYAPEIERLKERGGFVTADVVNITPETPNLEALLAKFSKEHTHSEDEVRFTVRGRGVFHIHPDKGPVFSVTVESGDLINVPRDTKHWFNLCEDHSIRCIRLFEDPSGWTPHYIDDNIDGQYAPLCMGPRNLSAEQPSDLKIDL